MDSDHDILIQLREQVRQLQEESKTRATREWFIIGGLLLALGNAALDVLTQRNAAEGLTAIVRYIGWL